MKTVEVPIRSHTDIAEAQYQALLALPRIAAALERLSEKQTLSSTEYSNVFGEPKWRINDGNE